MLQFKHLTLRGCFIHRTESLEKLGQRDRGEAVMFHVLLVYNLLDVRVLGLRITVSVGNQLAL